MNQRLIITLFLLTPITGFTGEFFDCNPDGAQPEINACYEDDFAAADKELNNVYKALLKKEAHNTVFLEKLRVAQRAWISFRDAELEAMYASENSDAWGSMQPGCLYSYKAKMTRDRTKRLSELLEIGQPADECIS